MAYSFLKSGLTWAPGSTVALGPNDGTDTSILPLENVPALAYQDEDSQPFLDEHGLTVIGEGYQNADPFDDPRSDDWQWDENGADDDSAVAIEMASHSAPVADATRADEDAYLDQVWDYDEPFVDLSESTAPVQAQAPPADSFGEDWFEWSEISPDAEQFDESAQVVADVAAAPALPPDEAWPDDAVGDEDDNDSAPVVANAAAVPAGIVEDAHDWLDEQSEEWSEDSAPVVADAVAAPAQPQGEDWAFDDEPSPAAGSDSYQQSDTVVNVDAIAPAEDWPWEDDIGQTIGNGGYQNVDALDALRDEDWADDVAPEDWVDDSAPVIANAAVVAPAPAAEEWLDDAENEDFDGDASPVIADAAVVAPAPAAEDWLDDAANEDFDGDASPVVADAAVVAPAPAAEDWLDDAASDETDGDSAPVADSDQFAADEWLDDLWDDNALDESAAVGANAPDALSAEDWADQDPGEEFDGDSSPVVADAIVLPPAIVDEQYDWVDDQPEEWPETSAPVVANAPAGIIDEQYDWIDDQPEEWPETDAPVGADFVSSARIARITFALARRGVGFSLVERRTTFLLAQRMIAVSLKLGERGITFSMTNRTITFTLG